MDASTGSSAGQGNEGKLGLFTFCDPDAGDCVTDAGIYNLSITGNKARFSGSGQLEDGTPVRFQVSATNNSPDTISITLDNGYSASGAVTAGDIRIE